MEWNISINETGIIVILFFLISLIYSSVGFGGGSSYAATLALFAIPYIFIPQTALICNIIVVTGGTIIFLRKGYLKILTVLPFIIGSIPMAFIGGMIPVQKNIYLTILAVILLISGIKIIFSEKFEQLWTKWISKKYESTRNFIIFDTGKIPFWSGIFLGMVVGLISGIVGIGGGILLSPVLHLMKWEKPKVISSISSFFILVNSISGLLGQLYKSGFTLNFEFIYIPAIAVFLGGQIGSRLGAVTFSDITIQRATAILLLFVSIRILWEIYF